MISLNLVSNDVGWDFIYIYTAAHEGTVLACQCCTPVTTSLTSAWKVNADIVRQAEGVMLDSQNFTGGTATSIIFVATKVFSLHTFVKHDKTTKKIS